ncbi:hypothetical protein SAMN05421810_11455 [Amycolatopsis arida]|uniref:Secreted protein n=1 Tax=Amycolatopsis arida TaxID=587909 RepID=A0A1I6AS74_9PSEU|nr:hypothetical protein [Amycolatopsis arida]TDX97568.1 hypothetical protein CLV69_102672 [Amycolatopsis arida]SFQ71476.1 hypothetical protein SAMN05421810_11455 [Amycolatopsis arida]
MGRRFLAATCLTAAVLLGTSGATAADHEERPGNQPLTNDHVYVLTQQHRDNLPWWNGTWLPQTVPSGAHLQLQLPSDPIRWIPDPECAPSPLLGLVPTWVLPLRATITPTGRRTLPSPGRITGSSAISVFDYTVDGLGIAAVCLRPHPVPDDPGVLGFPAGTPPFYVATVVVGVPQLTLP